MQQIFSQLMQFLQQGIASIFRIVEFVWNWTIGEITQITHSPWQSWPLWKQVVLAIVAVAVIYALFKAAQELWEAAERVLSAFATLLVALVRTLPPVLLAGVIALCGVWVINNVNLSSIHLPASFQLGQR